MVSVFVNLQIILSICLLLPFMFLRADQAFAVDVFAMAAYLPTYFGEPATNGRRRWDWFRFGFVMQDYMKWHQGKVIFTSDIPEKQRCVFAFAPHGVMV